MISPSCRRHHVAQTAHLLGKPLIYRGCITELPIVVASPTPQRPVWLNRQTMIKATVYITTNLVQPALCITGAIACHEGLGPQKSRVGNIDRRPCSYYGIGRCCISPSRRI